MAPTDKVTDLLTTLNRQPLLISLNVKLGGKGGIRTLDALTDIHDFESCAFDHSATFPKQPRW